MKEIWNDPELRAELKLLRYHLTAPIFFARVTEIDIESDDECQNLSADEEEGS